MGIARTVHSSRYFTTTEIREEIAATGLKPAWFGPGAVPLGYTGPVTVKNLTHAMEGRSLDGLILYVRPASVGRTRCGTEVVLCAPSSFSTLLAVTPQSQWDRIFSAHNQARQETMSELLQGNFFTRTRAGGMDRTPCQPVGVSLPNCYSRRGSPLVHSHDLILKQGYCPVDGKTRAVEMDPVFQNQRQIRADYLLRLSNRVVLDLGLPVERQKNSFVIPNIKPELVKELTPATHEIGKYLMQRKVPDTPAARAIAAKATAPDKRVFDIHERARSWSEVAQRHGVTVTLAEPTQARSTKKVSRELKAYEQAASAADRLAMRRNWFDEKQLLLETTRACFGTTLTPQDVRSAVERVLKRPEMFGYDRLDRGPELGPGYVRKSLYDEIAQRTMATKSERNRENQPSAPPRPEPSTAKATPKPTPKPDEATRTTKESETAKQVAATGETKGTSQHTEQDRKASRLERAKQTILNWFEKTRPPTVITVRADLPKSHPQSLARLLVDLQKTRLVACHAKVYQQVWGKWFANVNQKLSYAEAVFRAERQPKLRLDEKTIIVVENPSLASRKAIATLEKLAKKAHAEVRYTGLEKEPNSAKTAAASQSREKPRETRIPQAPPEPSFVRSR